MRAVGYGNVTIVSGSDRRTNEGIDDFIDGTSFDFRKPCLPQSRSCCFGYDHRRKELPLPH